MKIKKVTRDIFPKINLDGFNRQQKITRIYVRKNDTFVLEEQPGVMDWSLDKKREVAQDLMEDAYISYLALEEGRIIGFMSLVKELVSERMILDLIQVDKDFRGQGIGRMLWEKAVEEARLNGARELYISACPAEETIHFYRAMGANATDNPIWSIADAEPDDLQLVCTIMHAKLLGFFSGFPTHHFTDDIVDVLEENLDVRDSLVFISCQPDNYVQNDADSDGMHEMFAERNMPFAKHSVIDNRTKPDEAVKLIQEASCIFLMGGNATLQFKLMCDKGIFEEIRRSSAVILGVSAGAMNMGNPTVDIYESLAAYEGLGFANITIKAHYPLEDGWLEALKKVSMKLPVTLMTDESAIFVNTESIMQIGQIYRMVKGEITPLTQEQLEQMRK